MTPSTAPLVRFAERRPERPVATVVLVLLAALALGLAGCGAPSRTVSSWEPPLSDGRASTSDDLLDRLAPNEELWVIADEDATVSRASARSRDTGRWSADGPALVALQEDRGEIPLPLRATRVRAEVHGPLATTTVRQEFVNSFAGTIEVAYLFPLPEDAAVHEFVVELGERRIRGVVRPREQARRLYEAALREGHTAALLDQERPNLFRQRLGNLRAGEDVVVRLQYVHTCAFADGWHEYVFPAAVGDRYLPPGRNDDLVVDSTVDPGDVARLDLSVALDAGVRIEEIESPQYEVEIDELGPDRAEIRLHPRDGLPDRDFVLRWRVGDDDLRSAVFTHADARGGFWSVVLYPPRLEQRGPRQPLDLVLVLDSSGSMEGAPLEQMQRAAIGLLERLRPEDSFQLLRFSDAPWEWHEGPLAATRDNLRAAIEAIEDLRADGGTEMTRAIATTLARPRVPGRLQNLWLISDGFIGNEADVLREVDAALGGARLFTLGVGSSVNRYLMTALARVGGGASAVLLPRDRPDRVVDAFLDQVTRPALTGLELDWRGTDTRASTPRRVPDLFAGRMVVLSGRFDGPGGGSLRIRGRTADGSVEREMVLDVPVPRDDAEAVALLWARRRLTELADRRVVEPGPQIDAAIRELALEFGLVSDLTSFVAVDAAVRGGDEGGQPVRQPTRPPRWTPGVGGGR